MYQEEIKDILKQKREALYYITRDILYLYIELFLFRRNNIKERKQLIKMLQNYWREQRDEKEVLKLIATCFSSVDIHDDIEAILDELDFIFEEQYPIC